MLSNISKFNKLFFIAILFVAVFVLNGCIKKENKIEVKNNQKPLIVDNQNVNNNQNSNINSLENNNIINVDNWVIFNSQKNAGLKLNFVLKYPNDWLLEGSFDGGNGSLVPFYKKSRYEEICKKEKNNTTMCNTKGQVAHIFVTYNKDDQNEVNKYTVNGYDGYINYGINKEGVIGVSYISENKIWFVIPEIKGMMFKFMMVRDNEKDERIFYKILDSIKFID